MLIFLLVGCSHQAPGVRASLTDPKTGESAIHYLDWRRVEIREIWTERYHGKVIGFAIIAPYCRTHDRFKPIMVREWTLWDLRTEAEKLIDEDTKHFDQFEERLEKQGRAR